MYTYYVKRILFYDTLSRSSYGTFGFWSAYLAGGETVAAAGFSRRPSAIELHVRRGGLLPKWRTMRDPCIDGANLTVIC